MFKQRGSERIACKWNALYLDPTCWCWFEYLCLTNSLYLTCSLQHQTRKFVLKTIFSFLSYLASLSFIIKLLPPSLWPSCINSQLCRYSPGLCLQLLLVSSLQSLLRRLPVMPGRGTGRTAGRRAAARGASRSYPWCWWRWRGRAEVPVGGSRLEAEEHSVAAGPQVTLAPPSGPCPLLYRFTQPRPGGRCETTIPESTEGGAEAREAHSPPSFG